jgi:hypothetical protein
MSTTVPIQTNVPSHGNACGVLNNTAPLSDFIVRGGLGTVAQAEGAKEHIKEYDIPRGCGEDTDSA